MKKRVSKAFGKDVYLVGRNTWGELMWLEAPSWDCGWYWAFGYLEVYTRQNSPSTSRDVTSHSHWTGSLKHDFEEMTITPEEYAELNTLFEKFYKLRKKADKLHRNVERKAKRKEINEIKIPKITGKIIKILTP